LHLAGDILMFGQPSAGSDAKRARFYHASVRQMGQSSGFILDEHRCQLVFESVSGRLGLGSGSNCVVDDIPQAHARFDNRMIVPVNLEKLLVEKQDALLGIEQAKTV
jgi:hypothetical protein